MIMINTGDTPTRQREFRAWCFRHGLLSNDLVGPVCVDLTDGTVVLTAALPEPVPGDADFPEHRRDEANNRVTEQRVVPLVEAPAAWMMLAPAKETRVA